MHDRRPILRTARTELRPFEAHDADALLAVSRDPEVRRYLLDDVIVSDEWIHDEIESSDRRFADSGAGLWSIRLLDDPQIIGFAGFREFNEPPQLQLLYALLPSHWHVGLATEVTIRISDHAFNNLGFDRIEAAVDVPNVDSAAVLGRLGMRFDGISDQGPAGTAFYFVDRKNWRRDEGRRG